MIIFYLLQRLHTISYVTLCHLHTAVFCMLRVWYYAMLCQKWQNKTVISINLYTMIADVLGKQGVSPRSISSHDVILVYPKCSAPTALTHWGRVTHICVGKVTIIGSDNGMSPGRRQAIIWTNTEILLIGPLGANFSELKQLIHFHSENAFENIVCEMASISSRPQCVNHTWFLKRR